MRKSFYTVSIYLVGHSPIINTLPPECQKHTRSATEAAFHDRLKQRLLPLLQMSISLQTIVQFLDIFHSSPNIPGYCDVDVANLEEDERRDASLKDHNRIFSHNNIQAGHGIIDDEGGMVSRFQILVCKIDVITEVEVCEIFLRDDLGEYPPLD